MTNPDLMDLIAVTEIEVTNQKKNLVNDLEDLEETKKTNEFLETVMNDYKRYQYTIVEQKRKQQKLLLNILDYLDDLLQTQAITKYALVHTENEQKRLISEIQSLQGEMDSILVTV